MNHSFPCSRRQTHDRCSLSVIASLPFVGAEVGELDGENPTEMRTVQRMVKLTVIRFPSSYHDVSLCCTCNFLPVDHEARPFIFYAENLRVGKII
jgi:hypothetical protein